MNPDEFKKALEHSYDSSNMEASMKSKEQVYAQLDIHSEKKRNFPWVLLILSLLLLLSMIIAYKHWQKAMKFQQEIEILKESYASKESEELPSSEEHVLNGEQEKLTLHKTDTFERVVFQRDTIQQIVEVEKLVRDTLMISHESSPQIVTIYKTDTIYIEKVIDQQIQAQALPSSVEFNFNDEASFIKRSKIINQ